MIMMGIPSGDSESGILMSHIDQKGDYLNYYFNFHKYFK